MSCLSLTNLTGSTAVQSLPLPTAEIWRGVWRCLAQSQGAESTSTSTWLVASARRNQTLPQAAAKETSCVHILSQHLHPKPCHFYSALHPKGSLVGSWGRPRNSASSIGVEEQRAGCTIPSPSAGQGGHPGSLAPGSACWGSCSCCSHPTVTPQLSHHCLDVSPRSSPPRHPHTPSSSELPSCHPSVPGLSSGLPSWLFWKHFLK